MKMLNKPPVNTYLILFLFLLPPSVNHLSAQAFEPGYIITFEGERIEGSIRYSSPKNRTERIIFLSGESENAYLPNEIKAYGLSITGQYFASQILPGKFTEVLFQGAISLYKSDDLFLVQKGNGELHPLLINKESTDINGRTYKQPGLTWKVSLVRLTEDCFDRPNELVRPLNLNQKDLSKILRNYSNCNGVSSKAYVLVLPKNQIKIGVIGGWNNSFLQTNPRLENATLNLIDREYQTGNIHGGIIINWSLPRISQDWSLQTEAIYQRLSFHSSFLNERSIINDWVELNVDIQTISIPILLQFQKRIAANRLFIQAGISLDQHFLSNAERIREIVNQSIVSTQVEQLFTVEDSQTSLLFRIGILRQINNLPIGISFGYQQIPKLNTDDLLALEGHRIQLNLLMYIK